MMVTAQSISYMYDATLRTYEDTKQFCIDSGMVLAQPKSEELWLQQVAYLNDVAPR